MPQIINTNIASLTAQRNLNKSQSANQQALTRLSSGLRINSSKDDAAGLAISTRFTSQIKGLNVAIRNVGDGVSLAQTADGALGTMTDNLQRIRELAIQSANATNSDVDREALQAEVDQLVAEISRTGEQTTFNGIKLLDGNFDATFQIGANVGETVSFGINELTADSLGGGKSAGVSAVGSNSGLSNGDLVINGVVIGSSSAADDSASTTNAAASAIAKAAAINKVSDQTGVSATVLTNTATGTAMQATASGANATSGSINLNGVDISVATGDVDSTADRAAVITAINARSAETGVTAIDSGTAAGGVTLEAADGRNIALTFSTAGTDNLSAASTGLTSNSVTQGGYTLTSSDGTSAVVVTAGTGNLANAGLVAGSFSANTAAVNSTARSSRAEVTSDVGDTGARAATITGGETIDLTNANFAGTSTSFRLDITGAASSFENATDVVTLNKDYRNLSLNDLVTDINAALSGDIAAEAFADNGKLSFRRTSAEAGDLQLKNITVGTAPGGAATVRAALGLTATDAVSASATTLDSDTNVDRGGVIGRAALTGTASIAASIEADAAFTPADLSGGTGYAQFDLTVAGATTSADNGTYTLIVDNDFTNSLYADFATEAADRVRVLEEINEDIKNAGAENIIVASFDVGNTKLVFSRVTQETGGTIALDNYVASATSAAAQDTATGFTAGQVSTGVNGTVGADAKAAGATDAVGGQLIGVDTDSALINGGYRNGRAGMFAELDGTAAAGLQIGNANAAGFDFSGNTATFTITDGTDSTTVSLTTNLTDITGLMAEINTQMGVGNTDVTVTDSGGKLLFTADSTGEGSNAVITAITDGGGGNVLGMDTLVLAETRYGTTARTDGDFTYNLGGEDITINLVASGAGYTGSTGGTVIAAYINSQSGLDASYDTSTKQFTVSASDGVTDLTLVGGTDSALEYLGLTAGTYAHTAAKTGTATSAAVTISSLSEGDLKINGVTIGSSNSADDTASSSLATSSDKAASGIAIAAAINESSAETGVSATVNETVLDGGSASVGTADRTASGDTGVVHINGFATSTLSLGADAEVNRTDAMAAINKISGQTGVTASDAGGFLRLTAADGRNISVAIDSLGTTFSGANIGLSATQEGIAEADFTGVGTSFAAVAETTASSVTLTSAKEFSVGAGANGTAGLAGLGLVAGTYGGSEDGQFLSDVDITTVAGAEAAILALDNALATVSSQRADIGAIQNRLESTVGNLTVTAENLTAANSRILDADFAVETAELSRSQVLQQAGISILAQANASSQQVLSLLG